MTYLEQPVRTFPISTPFTHVNDFHEAETRITTSEAFYLQPVQSHGRMLFLLGFAVGLAVVFALIRPTADTRPAVVEAAPPAAQAPDGMGSLALISPLFSPTVQYWAPKIAAWAGAFDVDPNMVATVMQIESCGDPLAVSHAGAQGLFQVMPFHFAAGEVMLDPDTNARRGIAYLVERLEQTGGDVGRAFAGYNGGHVAAGGSWDSWADETQRYFIWSTGIYGEVLAGQARSETLDRWMQAGGASLCRQAAQRLGLQ